MKRLFIALALIIGAMGLAGCEQVLKARMTLQDAIGPSLCMQPKGQYTYLLDAQGDGYTQEEIDAIETLKAANCPDILARVAQEQGLVDPNEP